MIYNLLLNIINSGEYERENMLNKLDVFYAFNRISTVQYEELINKVI